MIRDARLGTGGERLEADVCVVGAGPSGLAVALSLINKGLRVLVVEAGPREPDVDNQRLASGEVTGLPYDPLEHTRARSFGGTAHLWNIDLGGGMPGVRLRRMDQVDFEQREWIPGSGWPFGLDALAPYYEKAEAFFGIEQQAYTLPDPSPQADPFLSANSPFEGTVFRFSTASSILDRQQEIEDEETLTVLLNAIVVRLERGPGGDIARLQAMSVTGNDFSLEAGAYVLAAGGIENARILLLSGAEGDGIRAIGNERDVVGRFFMEHPHTRAGFLVVGGDVRDLLAKEITNFEGTIGEPWFRVRDNVSAEHLMGNILVALMPVSASEMRRVLAMGATSDATRAARKLKARLTGESREGDPPDLFKTVLKGSPQIARAVVRKTRWALLERVRQADRNEESIFRIDVMAEQSPNPESRVTLSTRRDPLGMPRANLDWAILKRDIDALGRLPGLLDDLVERRGLGRFISTLDDSVAPINWGFHHMGTTRMHEDPAQGVVDPSGRVHEVANLYVAGSSVFPTSGVSNPTLTAVALSIRLAEHLSESVGR